MNKRSLAKASEELDSLTEQERRALRGSRFSSVQPSSSPSEQKRKRLAHPGGPVATNKAAALAKFLQRKLDQPGGLDSLDPALVERAVLSAKSVVNAGSSSKAPVKVRHVRSFSDTEEDLDDGTSSERPKPRKQLKPVVKKSKVSASARTSTRAAQKRNAKYSKKKK
eukprot:TRINITY_DN11470_c0_g1_i1.p1 TRINITY_DN11470_c0_g1~~TRINITY_DN11470_c0_g1_i1.p1  ORF type:complete len:167 (-),score=28.87 TRINITY_DN11470_c0_g1_i1:23-523(-)